MACKQKNTYPDCFGDLECVFPKGKDGLRNTPGPCLSCPHKIVCLRTAVSGSGGHTVRREVLDRAYSSGRMSFWERWSRKKALERRASRKD